MTSAQWSNLAIFTLIDQVATEQDSYVRLGRLAIPGRNVVETPNFIPLSSRGAIPHLTPDVMLRHARVDTMYLALEDFVERTTYGTPPIMRCPAGKSTPLHAFAALPSSLVTILAPRRSPAVPAPMGNTQKSISIFTSVGFQSLSSSEWVKCCQTLRPDIIVGLADVSHGAVPGTKRIMKMADRTSSWLDELLYGLRTTSNETPPSPFAVFAPILPIDVNSQSEYLDHLADDLGNEIHGLAFYSPFLLPEIPATTSLSRLPRLSIDNASSPHYVLRQISLGMDLFTIPFIDMATDAGLALTFELPSRLTATDSTRRGIHSLALDLSISSHATSMTPLLSTCNCYTCTSHSRAYIHHLLSAKEMLGWVLIQIHNHSIMSTFFSAIRESIQEGRFEEARNAFERRYESDLPAGGGEKPRARGYQFKSEGPGEKRKNKPAWAVLADSDVSEGDRGSGERTSTTLHENASELDGKALA